MTREIKLRAWSTTGKVMHPVWKKTDDENGEYIIMQSIDLFDKNGKEIYEGDILKWSIIDIDGSTVMQIDVVERESGYFTVGGDCVCEEIHQEQISVESEIIGNKYDNPELV